ncbi:hypothetical protein [Xylella fastidiosa]|uniref:hypothetical protein n=1 Tax=Xylella fastidiosa TaxID=2371 RepID=UPI0003D30B25|nr:hypothetical protein [Xylella fastidiosa]KXB17494.1 hypothetical protein ADT30_00385 [Xylella fastidiosa]OJZ69133.1 hypothetical protein B375_0211785 [Xylella fastidiosa 6c]
MENEIHSTVSDQATLPTPINVNLELGRLLNYVADVAKAIRMNSPYNGKYKDLAPHEVGLDVMQLANSLHCLGRLGDAIKNADNSKIVDACDALMSYYAMFTEGGRGEGMKGDPKASFDRHCHICNPQQAISVFAGISDKALAKCLEKRA